MRFAPVLGLLMLFAGTPAHSTGGFLCRATDGSGIAIGGTVGHTIASPLVAAHLQLGDRRLRTSDPDPRVVVGRSWIDEREIRVDLVDPDAMRFEAQLRARTGARGVATGTLVRDGVTYPVRCEME